VYIQTGLGLPAHNARRDARGLLAVVRGSLEKWVEGQGSRVEGLSASTEAAEKVDPRLLTLDAK
jgi:hypothetical protein